MQINKTRIGKTMRELPNRQYPDSFYCSINKLIMDYPVITSCQHSFEKEQMQQLVLSFSTGNPKCPNCRSQIHEDCNVTSHENHNFKYIFKPNQILNRQIQLFNSGLDQIVSLLNRNNIDEQTIIVYENELSKLLSKKFDSIITNQGLDLDEFYNLYKEVCSEYLNKINVTFADEDIDLSSIQTTTLPNEDVLINSVVTTDVVTTVAVDDPRMIELRESLQQIIAFAERTRSELAATERQQAAENARRESRLTRFGRMARECCRSVYYFFYHLNHANYDIRDIARFRARAEEQNLHSQIHNVETEEQNEQDNNLAIIPARATASSVEAPRTSVIFSRITDSAQAEESNDNTNRSETSVRGRAVFEG